MAKLIYNTMSSLDGFSADVHGNFDFAMPDAEVHSFVNELSRPIGTYLFGRRMYEVMTWWDGENDLAAMPPYIQDFAELWAAADKVVYTRTLTQASGPRTFIERRFDAHTVEKLKATAPHDIGIGGPTLASHALRAGLVDEIQLLLSPVIIGGGLHVFPADVRLELELIDERRFASGVVYVAYAVKH